MGSLLQVAGSQADQLFMNSVQPSEFRRKFQHVRWAARETRKLYFSTEAVFGCQSAVVVPHDGDLLVGASLQVKLQKLPNEYPVSVASYYPIEALVKRVSIAVGGTVLDTHTSDFFRLYDEYIRTADESQNYRRIANFDPDTLATAVTCTETLYLPLVFSFFRSRHSALPLAGAWDSEVRLTFDFATAEEVGVDPSVFEAAVYADYALVDPVVRQELKKPTQLMFEQLQTNGGMAIESASQTSNVTVRARLGFRRHVKALWWFLKETEAADPNRTNHARWIGDWQGTYLALQPSQNDFGGYNLLQSISDKLTPLKRVRLLFDGADRFPAREARIFNTLQPLKYCGRAPLPGSYVYAFGDDIASLQPTPGICNFSRFKDIQLILQLKKTTSAAVTDMVAFAGENAEEYAKNIDGLRSLNVYAWSYNILNIENGRVGVCVN